MTFRVALPALAIAGVVVLATGCGGSGSASPPVASNASGTTTPSTTTPRDSGPSTSSGAPGSDSGRFSLAMKVPSGAEGRKFSACMRSHGVPNFPDPNGQGVIQISGGPGSALDPGSPRFQSAQRTCRKLFPTGGHASPAQIAAARRQALAYSTCMRRHGVPGYPDPSFSGNSVQFKLDGSAGGDPNPRSPKFQAARQVCKDDLPGKARGATLTNQAGPK